MSGFCQPAADSMFWEKGEELFPVEESTGKIALGKNPSYVDTWRAMENVFKKGEMRAIGISNFNQKEIQDLLDQCEVMSINHMQMKSRACFLIRARSLRFIRWNYIVSSTTISSCSRLRLDLVNFSKHTSNNPNS